MLPFRMTRQTRRMRAGVSANLKRPTNQGNEISFISTRRVCVVLLLVFFFAIFLWHQAFSRTSCALHHMPAHAALWAARAVQTTAADSCAKSRKKMRKIENKKTRNYRISI